MAEEHNLRILVVDDEGAFRCFLKAALLSHGYSIFESTTGSEALKSSVRFHPDVVILDLGLPDMDGIEVIRAMRRHSKTPIVVLSVREDVADKVSALDAGADDYLTKPFSTGELLARLRAVVRRLLPSEKAECFHEGDLCVDVTKHRVTVKDKEVDLSPTEYDVLKLLIMNPGKVLTHKRILREVWNKSEDLEGALHLLRVTVSNLRAKIEPDPDRPVHVLTEPGIGYRLRSRD